MTFPRIPPLRRRKLQAASRLASSKRHATKQARPLIEQFESRVLLSAWYVAPSGSSDNPGTLQQPFATIQQAADVAQAGDVVLIRGGTYHETVTPVNSGTAGEPITFEPYQNESVTIDGADPVTGWTSDLGHIFDAPQTKDLGEGNNQVFVDGVMVNELRYPNSSSNPSSPTWATATSVKVTQSTTGGLSSVTIFNSALSEPAGTLVGAIAHIAAGAEWVDQAGLITANSPGSITVSYVQETSYQVPTAGNRFYIVGSFQTLDAAGEWYRDPNSGLLYLWDPAGDSPGNHTVEAKARLYGFDLSGRSNINVEGINLFAATVNTDANSTNILLDHLTATYVSQTTGISPDTQDPWNAEYHPHSTGIILNGQYDVLQNSTIAFSSGDGVFVGGSNNTVRNCLIHDADYEAGDEVPIDTQGSHQQVLYNTVYNAGRSGIVIRNTTASQIEHNNVYSVGLQMTDLGGIYTFGTDGQGTEIAYNTIDGIHAGGYGAAGIYLDNSSQNYVVDHNLVYNCDFALKMNPPSTNNLIVNNTFEGNSYGLQSSGNEDMTGSVIENNIFNRTVMFGPGVTQSHNILPGTNPLFVNASQNNYQLQSTSPAINAGMIVAPYTNNHVGIAPDIGAFEYGALAVVSGFSPVPFVSLAVNHPTVAVAGNLNANPGALYNLNIGAVADPGFAVSQYIVHWGDGTMDTYSAGGAVTHSFNNSSPSGIFNTISVDLVDNSGPGGVNFTALGAGTLHLTINPYPSVSLSGLSYAIAGDTYQLSIGMPIDTGFTVSQVVVNWGDATSSTYAISQPASAITATHVYSAPQTTTIAADLIDNAGSYPSAGSLPLAIVGPTTVTLAGAPSVNVGDLYTVTLAGDNDPVGVVSSFIVHWGDNTTNTVSALGDITHTYASTGSPTIIVDTVDQNGTSLGVGHLSLAVIQPPVAPTLALYGNSNANAGGTYTLTLGSINDANGTPSQYVVHWGDSVGDTSTYAMPGAASHTYTTPGVSNITVDVIDPAGTWAAAGSTPVTINTAPTVALSGTPNPKAGSAFTLNLAAATDPGHAVSQYTIHWGDGTSTTTSASGAVTHAFASAGSASITVDVTDDTGTYTTAGAMNLTVLNPGLFTDSIDIGAPKAAGSASFANGAYTVNGSGADIGNTSDQFHYDYANVSGSMSITAQVTAVQNISTWSKAGVMIRDGTAANAAFADVVVTPGGHLAFQWRARAGAHSVQVIISGKFVPQYVKLIHTANSFAAYYSKNGINWTQIGKTQAIVMSNAVTAGLAVTSTNLNKTSKATFSNVSIGAPPLSIIQKKAKRKEPR